VYLETQSDYYLYDDLRLRILLIPTRTPVDLAVDRPLRSRHRTSIIERAELLARSSLQERHVARVCRHQRRGQRRQGLRIRDRRRDGIPQA
jgi:hypothetical protein